MDKWHVRTTLVLMVALMVFITGCDRSVDSNNNDLTNNPARNNSIIEPKPQSTPPVNAPGLPLQSKSIGNTSGNIANGGTAAFYGDTIYYCIADDIPFFGASQGGLYAINVDGSNRRKLNDDIPAYINVINDRVYYANWSDYGYIYSVSTDGSNRQKLNEHESWYINVTDDGVYYANAYDGYIYFMRADGSNRVQLNNEDSTFINVVEDRIYYINSSDFGNYDGDDKIYSIKIDGSDKINFGDDVALVLMIVNDRIYYINSRDGGGGDGKIYTINIDGSNKQCFSDTSNLDDYYMVFNVLNDTFVYVSWNYDTDYIDMYVMESNGGNKRKLMSSDRWIVLVNIFGDLILYWQDVGVTRTQVGDITYTGTEYHIFVLDINNGITRQLN